jgi:hypothetical protein|tara:strand:- start:5902 stop:6051 length:150 start_codon:yes stop_codon:yes gene_type:complete
MTEKEAEMALKAIPASIRRATVSDLKKRELDDGSQDLECEALGSALLRE